MFYTDVIHPGEILMKEFVKPLKLNLNKIAREINVPRSRLAAICSGNRRITLDTAHKLGKFFGVSTRFWLNLQTDYDYRIYIFSHEG